MKLRYLLVLFNVYIYANCLCSNHNYLNTVHLSSKINIVNENSYLSLITSIIGIQILIAKYAQQWKIYKTLNGHSLNISSITFSNDVKFLVSGSDDESIKIWDLKAGCCIATLNGHKKPVSSVIVSPNCKFIASGSYDNSIRIWDFNSFNCIREIANSAKYINSIAYSPDSNHIAYGNWGGIIKLLSTITGQCSTKFNCGNFAINLVVYSPDGQQIACCAIHNNDILIFEPKSGNCIHTLKGHIVYVKSIEYSSDSKFLVSTSDDSIIIWDTQLGKCLKILNGYKTNISNALFSPKGQHLAAGFDDKIVQIIDISSGDFIDTISSTSNIDLIAYSPCGRYIACVSGKNIILWENYSFKLLDSV